MNNYTVYDNLTHNGIQEAINNNAVITIEPDDSPREVIAKLNKLSVNNVAYVLVPTEEGGIIYQDKLNDYSIEDVKGNSYPKNKLTLAPFLTESNNQVNDGSDADYYDLPPHAKELSDLIEYKKMDFNEGNIQKAIYRLNDKNGRLYNLNKIKYHNDRLIAIELAKLDKLNQSNNESEGE